MTRDYAGPFVSRQKNDNSWNPVSLVKSLRDRGMLGYRVMPTAMFKVDLRLYLLLPQDEGRWAYRITLNHQKVQAKELADAAKDGYLPIGGYPIWAPTQSFGKSARMSQPSQKQSSG